MNYKPPFKRNDTIDTLCMEISELVGTLTTDTPIAKSPHLHRELRIKTIYSSLVIEGNELDRNAVSAILDGKPVIGNKKDILEVENAKRAYELLDKLNPYRINDLLKAHNVMMHNLIPSPGTFRTKNVGVFDGSRLIHAGTPSNYVPEVMADIFTWLKDTKIHPLLSSCIFHFEFEFCHPFSDGNGRIGRLWHTLLLSKWRPPLAWLPIENTIRQQQSGYYEALATSGAAGSSEIFVEFMLKAIKKSLKPFTKTQDKRTQIKVEALEFFTNNPHGNINQLAEYLSCSKRSAERIVAELKSEGKLKRNGSTRAGIWSVSNIF